MTNELTVNTASATELMLNQSAMESMNMLAGAMASSAVTVPKHLQGNQSDCLAVVMQAAQWGMNPFAVAQKTHIVSGNLGYEAQLVNAVISSSRAITGRFKYEYTDWNGDNGFVRVGAVIAGESDITWGEWLDTRQVKTKNSPLWKTAPKQQAAYLAVKYWARLYCPEVILGVYSADELEPVERTERDVTPQVQTKSEALNNLLKPKQVEPEPTGPTDEELQQAAEFAISQFEQHKTVEALDAEWDQAAAFLDGSPWMKNIQASYQENKSRLISA